MTEENKDNLFNEKFSDFEVTPSMGSFDMVRTKMDRLQKRKRRRAVLWLLSGIIGIGALASFLIRSGVPETKEVTAFKNNIELKTAVPKTTPVTTLTKVNAGKGVAVEKPANDVRKEKVTGPPVANSSERKPDMISQTPATNNPPINVPESESTLTSGNPSQNDVGVTGEPISSKELLQASDAASVIRAEEFIPLLPIQLPVLSDSGEIIVQDLTDSELDKNLLQLKAREFKPMFFIGLSYQPTLRNYSFAQNPGPTIPTAYSTNTEAEYVKKRNANKEYTMTGIPGFKLGLILKRAFVIGATFGYYKTRDHEQVETLKIDTVAPPVKSFIGNVFVPTSSSTEARNYTNHFSYVYASLDLGWMIKQLNYRIMPSVSLGYHKITKGSYVILDQYGYNYVENNLQFLNKVLYTVTFKAGFRRNIWHNCDLQLSPAFVFSLSSLFVKNYFVSQKPYGFGLEGALLYKFKP